MLILTLIVVFLLIIGSTCWFGLWNNIITLCNFLIAAIAAYGLRELVNDVLELADPQIAKFGDLLSVWGVFVLATIILRSGTDSLSTVRLRFHPVLELVGRFAVCTVLAVCFILFSVSTLSFLEAATVGKSVPLVDQYRQLGLYLWSNLSDYWLSGPFAG